MGPQHWCSPPASAQQDGGTALHILMSGPICHHQHPDSTRALGRSNGHHHPTTTRSGITAHAPGSAFDCNSAVTDFPLLCARAFPLRLSLSFLSSPITSPLPIPVLLPGTAREPENMRISVCLGAGTQVQDSIIQTPKLSQPRTGSGFAELQASSSTPPAPTTPGAAPNCQEPQQCPGHKSKGTQPSHRPVPHSYGSFSCFFPEGKTDANQPVIQLPTEASLPAAGLCTGGREVEHP